MNNIGEKIRELRLKENMTQETLAEGLNVSFQSVSRWENGMSMPDISLVPIIARFFYVSIDELFGMNNEVAQYDKEQYEVKFREFRKNGDIESAYQCMLEARKQYPRDMHICVNLAEIMDLYEGGTVQQTVIYKESNFSNQIYILCKRVLDESRNEQDRNRAMKILCNHYVKAGNTTEAINIANSMTDMFHSREILLGEILTGDEKLKQLQANILTAAEYIASMLVKIPFQKEYGFTARFTHDEKIEYVSSANGIYRLLISDENYLIHHRDICWNDRRLAELFLLKGDRDKAFEYLLDAEKHARLFDCMNKRESGSYTSLVLSSVECRPEDYPKAWKGSEIEMLAYRLDEMKTYFDGHAGFDELKKRIGNAGSITIA